MARTSFRFVEALACLAAKMMQDEFLAPKRRAAALLLAVNKVMARS